jgi:hypothetical protein
MRPPKFLPGSTSGNPHEVSKAATFPGRRRHGTAQYLPEVGMASQYPWMVPVDQPLLHTGAATMMMVDGVGWMLRLYFFSDHKVDSAPEFQGDPVLPTV